ncbi:MAG TPA: ABC transporter permease, partial [Blastocatellia bacterium]|nr:ABC transporter permease [Blastocatellia bacterium]
EWEAELRHRETLLAEWDKLNWQTKLDLWRRSLGAFWDALLLQPQRWEDEMMQDLRYGVRMLFKHKGFTLIAVLTLSLGVGLSTVIFSLTYSLLLRALPYPNAERLVMIWLTHPAAAAAGNPRFSPNALNWLEWQAQAQSFEDLALARTGLSFNLTGAGRPERVVGIKASANLAQVFGLPPQLGRMFTAEEAMHDAKLVVLSNGFWTRGFARDTAVIGRRIQLNGEAYEVIGVLPPEFQFPANECDLLTPLLIPREERLSPTHFYYKAIARLKAGVTVTQAQAETTAITARVDEQKSDRKGPSAQGTQVESLLQTNVGQFRTTLYVLLAAVGSLLLIGCINLGGLFLVRANARTHEFAVRAALGASRSRLYAQTLCEVLPLGLLGAGAGVLLAWALLKVLVNWLPPSLLLTNSFGLHWPVLAVALALSLSVVMLAAMLPARLAARVRLAETIQQGARTVTGGGSLRHALVVAQIAVTLALVFAGGLLVRSLVAVLLVSPGFSPQGVLTMQMQVTRAQYPTDAEVGDYYHRLLARVRTIPGVAAAGIGGLPFSQFGGSGPVEFAARPNEEQLPCHFRQATLGLFPALGVPLLRGREFTEHDREGAPPVAIIDEQLARRAFGDANPIGQRIRFGVIKKDTPWVEIVGVVGHIRVNNLESDPTPQLYWPAAQTRLEMQRGEYRVGLAVRTAGQPEAFTSAVIEQIQKENPGQPVYDIRTLSDRLEQSLQARHLLTGLVMVFGGAALLLACLGLYGVVSYGTGLRLREFAIRTALGAQSRDVRRIVFAQAAKLWAAGSAIGLPLAWLVGRALQSQLYGVGAADVPALAAAPCLLLVVALLAGFGPARKAGRVNPAVTLRGE